jgi:hypothetical protein
VVHHRVGGRGGLNNVDDVDGSMREVLAYAPHAGGVAEEGGTYIGHPLVVSR